MLNNISKISKTDLINFAFEVTLSYIKLFFKKKNVHNQIHFAINLILFYLQE
jgi:hypothetical protein